jgi:Aerobic-type carbon monoxide dehydrogenase, middle subunit CoxM/CutM homologs
MLLDLIEYHWAEDVDDVLLLLNRLDVRTVPLAGGTYLLGLQDTTIEAVVDLRDLELAYISEDQRGLHIGAMTTLQQMVEAPLLKEFLTGLLARSAQLSANSRLIRNCATIGGTLGAGRAAQADLLTALVATDAEVVVRSGSKTQFDLSGGTYERPGLALSGVVYKGKHERRFLCGDVENERRPNELIMEVVIPRPALSCGTSLMRVSRTPTDVALLNAAALVEINGGRYQRVRLVLGGANMDATRLVAVEQQFEGAPVMHPLNSQHLLSALQSGMSGFRPSADIRASSSYRRVSGMGLAYRALEEAMNVAYWHSMVSSEKGS